MFDLVLIFMTSIVCVVEGRYFWLLREAYKTKNNKGFKFNLPVKIETSFIDSGASGKKSQKSGIKPYLKRYPTRLDTL